VVAAEPIVRKEDVVSWLDEVRATDRFSVAPSHLARSGAWSHRDGTIRHRSGRFFNIVGLTWKDGAERRRQPFIEQREIGTLGFIGRRGDCGMDLLVQAKSEPGNVGTVQLAPTCQATASNRDRVHGGHAPPYSEYFAMPLAEIISDSLQSEEGTRFLAKRNRNVVVLDDHAEAADDQHRWMPFRTLRRLLVEDFMVNTDARSVLCTTNWERLAGRKPFQGDDDFSRELNASFGARIRSDVLERTVAGLQMLRTNAPTVESCELEAMPGWRFNADDPITATDGRLSVRHIEVHAGTREVSDWDQPILENGFEQAIDLDCGRESGTLQFGFRLCWEPGLHDAAELSPTRIGSRAVAASAHSIRLRARQSNEGGRFFRDIADYRILDIGETRPEDGVVWLTLAEVHALLQQGFFNNEARSALSLLLSLA
jgi:dTDP-4-dehydro-6-deoxy-alpha-D-glucopyranose 2,3-dehydratase